MPDEVAAIRPTARVMPSQFVGNKSPAWQELRNKFQVFYLFEHFEAVLGPASGDLRQMVSRAERLGPYLSLWALEGIAYRYADSSWSGRSPPWGLLREVGEDLSPATVTSMHVGMGLSVAERLLRSLGLRSYRRQVAETIAYFVEICEANSQPDYLYAALEALGFSTRALFPFTLPMLADELSALDQELSELFWHGVGRALYFVPSNLAGWGSSTAQAIEMARREPPIIVHRLNAVSGLAWAATLVNIRHAEIVARMAEAFGFSAADEDEAVRAGIRAAVTIWRATDRDGQYVEALSRHCPPPDARPCWERLVRDAVREAQTMTCNQIEFRYAG